MAENVLISHLRKGDFSRCSPFLEKALLGGENLVNFLNDLLLCLFIDEVLTLPLPIEVLLKVGSYPVDWFLFTII